MQWLYESKCWIIKCLIWEVRKVANGWILCKVMSTNARLKHPILTEDQHIAHVPKAHITVLGDGRGGIEPRFGRPHGGLPVITQLVPGHIMIHDTWWLRDCNISLMAILSVGHMCHIGGSDCDRSHQVILQTGARQQGPCRGWQGPCRLAEHNQPQTGQYDPTLAIVLQHNNMHRLYACPLSCNILCAPLHCRTQIGRQYAEGVSVS